MHIQLTFDINTIGTNDFDAEITWDDSYPIPQVGDNLVISDDYFESDGVEFLQKEHSFKKIISGPAWKIIKRTMFISPADNPDDSLISYHYIIKEE